MFTIFFLEMALIIDLAVPRAKKTKINLLRPSDFEGEIFSVYHLLLKSQN